MFDGRIFAAALPPEVDRIILLNAVGMSSASDVEIYVPGAGAVVDPREQVRIRSGQACASPSLNQGNSWATMSPLTKCCEPT